MGGSSFTFRCGECNRLLGVSRSRIGSTVQCPKCGTDLVVPDPDDGQTPTPEIQSSGSSSSESATIGAATVRETTGFAGIAIESEPFSLRPREPSRPHRVPDRSAPPAAVPVEPVAVGGLEGLRVEDAPLRGTAAPALAPETRPQARVGDVVLPRTALMLWSFVMLVALVLAFTAGILAGHFLWKPPTAMSAPAPVVPTSAPAARG